MTRSDHSTAHMLDVVPVLLKGCYTAVSIVSIYTYAMPVTYGCFGELVSYSETTRRCSLPSHRYRPTVFAQ